MDNPIKTEDTTSTFGVPIPEIQSVDGLTPLENAYLGSLDPEVQQIYREEPALLRGAMRASKAEEILLKPETEGLTLEQALKTADDHMRTEEEASLDVDFEELPVSTGPIVKRSVAKPVGMWEGDFMKATVRGPMTALYRFGDVAKAAVIGPVVNSFMDSVDWAAEKITGKRPEPIEAIRELSKRSSEADEELWVSLDGTVQNTTEAGQTFTEIGSFITGYAATTIALPVLLPLAAIQGLGAANAAIAGRLGPSAQWAWNMFTGFLKASIKGDITSGVFGPQQTMTEILLRWWDTNKDKNLGVEWAKWYDTQPEFVRVGVRTAESTLMSIPIEAAFGSFKAFVGRQLAKNPESLGKALNNAFEMPQGGWRTEELFQETRRTQRQADLEWAFRSPKEIEKLNQRAVIRTAESVRQNMGAVRAGIRRRSQEALSKAADLESFEKAFADVKSYSEDIAAYTANLPVTEATNVEAARVARETAEWLKTNEKRFTVERLYGEAQAELQARLHALETFTTEAEMVPVAKEAVENIEKTASAKTTKPIGKAKKKKAPKSKSKGKAQEAPASADEPVVTPEELKKDIESVKTSEVAPVQPETQSKPAVTYSSKRSEKRAKEWHHEDGSITGIAVFRDTAGKKESAGIGIVTRSPLEADVVEMLTKDEMSPAAVASELKISLQEVTEINTALNKITEAGELPANNKLYDLWTGEQLPVEVSTLRRVGKQKAGLKPSKFNIRSHKAGSWDVADFMLRTVEFTSGAWATPGAVLAIDLLDGKVDANLETYLKAAGIGMGLKAVSGWLLNSGKVLTKTERDLMYLNIASGKLDLMSTQKWGLSPEASARYFSQASEDVLRGSQKSSERILNKVLDAVVPTNGQTFNAGADLSNIIAEFPTGRARGSTELVEASVFYSPTTLYTAVSDTFQFLRNRLSNYSLQPQAAGDIAVRWGEFIKNYQLSDRALETYMRITGGTPEGLQAIMTTLDSYERFAMENLAKALADTSTLSKKALASEALAHVQTMRKLYSDPASLMTIGSNNQALFGRFLAQVTEDEAKNMGGLGIQRFVKKIDGIVPELKAFVDSKGNVNPEMTTAFYGYLKGQELDPTMSELVQSGFYHAMLSSYVLVKDSIIGNAWQTAQSVGAEALTIPVNWLRGDSVGVDASYAFLENFASSLPSALRNTVETLRTGRKIFDPLGQRMVYRNLATESTARVLGGGDAAVPVISRMFSRFTELFGISPGAMTKALDVMPQTMLHAGYLQKELTERAHKLIMDSNSPMSFNEAMQKLLNSPSSLGEASDVALNKARGAVGIEATKESVMSGQNIVREAGILGSTIEEASKIQQKNPFIRALQPFFTTDAFFTNEALRYNPIMLALGEVYDMVFTKRGMTYTRLLSSSYENLTASTKVEVGRRLTEMGARAATGTIFGLTFVGAMASLGYQYVSPLFSQDKHLKNLGIEGGTFVQKGTGKTVDTRTLSNLAVLFTCVDPIFRAFRDPDPDEELLNDATVGGMALEYLISMATPESLESFAKNLGKVYSGDSTAGDKMLETSDVLFRSIVSRAQPTIIKLLQEYHANRRTYKPKSLGEATDPVPFRNLRGQTTGVSPVSALGHATEVPFDEFSRTLANHGVDVGSPRRPKFGGVTVDDPRLIDKYRQISGKYLDTHSKSLLDGLKQYSDFKTRQEIVKNYIRVGLDRAEGELFEELVEFYEKKTGEKFNP